MSKRPLKTLYDIINIKHGFPFKSEFFVESGRMIVLTPGNFYEEGGFKRQDGKDKYYKGEIPKDYILKKGDLLVAMTEQAAGLLGSCAIVPESDIYLHNQRLGLIITDENRITKDYLYHLFKTKFVREQIRLTSTGSKVKHTSPTKIYDVLVPLPEIYEQKRISNFLSALDEKIELNNKINAKLEEMAKFIYDYWFIQFDFPDINGKPYKSSGGKMIYNDVLKRELPEGWSDVTLGDILAKPPKIKKIKNKDILKNGLIPVIDQGKSYISGYTNAYEASITPSVPHIIFGDHTRVVKLVNFDYARGADGTQILISNIDEISSNLFYQMVRDIDLSNYGYARHFKFLKESKIIKPVKSVSICYENLVAPIFDKIKLGILENQMLIKLRNWLLPMLIHGQVSIK